MKQRFWKITAAAMAIIGLAAMGSTARPAEAGKRMILKRFLLGRLEPNTYKFIPTGATGTSNAYRDNVVMLVFSRPVNFDSLDKRTVKIGIPASTGLFIDAPGEFYPYTVRKFDPGSGTFIPQRTYKNRVIFDPTKRFEDIASRNPYGFEQNSLYTVIVPGLEDTTKVVRGKGGEFNVQTFTTTFRTSDRYLQDYAQPSILKIEASDAPGVPLEGRTTVDSRADITVYFSEPMLPASVDPNTTFQVYNFGQSRLMSGVIRPSTDGTAMTFRPAFGYGRGPYDVRVTISRDIVDRSNNRLDKGLVVNFTTEFDPLAPNYNEVIEGFDDTVFADFGFPKTYDFASWAGWVGPTTPPLSNSVNFTNKNLGLLAGVFGARTQQIDFTHYSGYSVPWWYNPVRAHNLYYAAQMGNTARTIAGYAWEPYYGTATAGASYSAVSVLLGHNTTGSVSTGFASFSDTPQTMFSGSYSPNTSEQTWTTGPAFTGTWAYNGKDNLVIEHNLTSAMSPTLYTNYWRYTNAAGGAGSTHYDTLNGTATLTWNECIRFFYLVDRSEMQSKWFDSTVTNPTWLDPIVQQTVPPGTVIQITYQGAHENPSVPGAPDEATATAWSTDPFTDLGGFRFLRFHVDMTSNLGSSTRPTIDEIKLPHIYY